MAEYWLQFNTKYANIIISCGNVIKDTMIISSSCNKQCYMYISPCNMMLFKILYRPRQNCRVAYCLSYFETTCQFIFGLKENRNCFPSCRIPLSFPIPLFVPIMLSTCPLHNNVKKSQFWET